MKLYIPNVDEITGYNILISKLTSVIIHSSILKTTNNPPIAILNAGYNKSTSFANFISVTNLMINHMKSTINGIMNIRYKIPKQSICFVIHIIQNNNTTERGIVTFKDLLIIFL